MSELSQDDEIINALGLNPDESPDDLVWVRLYPHYYIPQTEEEVKKNIVKGYKKAFPPTLRSVKPTYEDLHDYFGVSIYKIDPKKGYTHE